MKIVFLGTPDFAVPSLQALINSRHEILAVVTQPDKERDRKQVTPTPVKVEALKNNIKVLEFNKIRIEGVEELKKLNPDIMVTCAYGQIISQEILDIPKYGVINVHGSLLPKYRGSAPIQWAVIKGEKETGITIMQTALGVDSGDIILQEKVDINKGETAGELFDRLAKIAPNVLLKAIDQIENGTATFTKQDESKVIHLPMLKKEDGIINWNENALDIVNKILGMNPWPSAYTKLNDKMFKIHKAEVLDMEVFNKKPGEVFLLDKKNAAVMCGDKAIKLIEIQLEGKKKMPIDSFLVGFNIDGVVLG